LRDDGSSGGYFGGRKNKNSKLVVDVDYVTDCRREGLELCRSLDDLKGNG